MSRNSITLSHASLLALSRFYTDVQPTKPGIVGSLVIDMFDGDKCIVFATSGQRILIFLGGFADPDTPTVDVCKLLAQGSPKRWCAHRAIVDVALSIGSAMKGHGPADIYRLNPKRNPYVSVPDSGDVDVFYSIPVGEESSSLSINVNVGGQCANWVQLPFRALEIPWSDIWTVFSGAFDRGRDATVAAINPKFLAALADIPTYRRLGESAQATFFPRSPLHPLIVRDGPWLAALMPIRESVEMPLLFPDVFPDAKY